MAAASSKRAPENTATGVGKDQSTASGVWSVAGADQEIVAYAVHDAKSVLGALIVNVDWLRGALAKHPVEGADEALDDVAICCNRLNVLLKEALRSASGRAVRDGVASIRVGALANKVADAMRRQAESRQIVLDVIEGQDAQLLGEEQALERVLCNLVDNAIRFSAPGGRVVLSYGVENNSIMLTVADEGPGVPVEMQEQVFQAFQTTNRESMAPGEHAGLGLAFCRKVIRQHGGDVMVSNRPVAGALFSITLPIV